MENWREAAEKYRQAQPAVAQDAQKQRCEQVARKLQDFLVSRLGLEALELLKASRRHIIFGEDPPEGGHTVVYFLNGEGLRQSCEASGMWTAYSASVPRPSLSLISALEAVQAAVKFGRKDPDGLLRWLREELDKIALAAPTSTPK
ncbi:MAG: hypothetical protein WC641_02230 [Patescibacteria group bacterium]